MLARLFGVFYQHVIMSLFGMIERFLGVLECLCNVLRALLIRSSEDIAPRKG